MLVTGYRWCHDIGREQAANRPLLKTVFQVHIIFNITSNKIGSVGMITCFMLS